MIYVVFGPPDIVHKDNKKEEKWNFDLRFFFRYEVEHLINQSRLQLINLFGDFEEQKLTANSKEFIIECKRPD